MDDHPNTNSERASQGAPPRLYRRRDGSLAVAHDEDGVTWLGRLIIIPDGTGLDRFEVAVQSARDELETAAGAVVRGVAGVAREGAFALDDFRVEAAARAVFEDAFARYDFCIGAALEALREALKP